MLLLEAHSLLLGMRLHYMLMLTNTRSPLGGGHGSDLPMMVKMLTLVDDHQLMVALHRVLIQLRRAHLLLR